MKPVVIYKSKYGATKQYAEWISQELQCPILEADSTKAVDMEPYDTIIFGGGIHAGGITGISVIKKNYRKIKDKRIFVFGVGINVDEEKNMEDVREINFTGRIKHLPCFLCRGAYDPTKVSGFDKFLMNQVRKMIMKKPIIEREQQEKDLVKTIDYGGNWISKEYIEPILKAVREEE